MAYAPLLLDIKHFGLFVLKLTTCVRLRQPYLGSPYHSNRVVAIILAVGLAESHPLAHSVTKSNRSP